MSLEVEIILSYRVEQTVILNDITQENNNFLEDESKQNAKFHKLERIMENSVSTLQSVVEAEQRNYGPQIKRPLA